MIFVTIGTHSQSFNRLLEEIDRLIGEKMIKEKIFVEIGNSNYKPKNYKYTKLLPFERYQNMMAKSDIVIAHGGLGSIMDALKNNKKLIIVPRRKKFDEHVDDHQMQIAGVMEKSGRAIAVYDIKYLEMAIKKVKKLKTKRKQRKYGIIEKIQSFIEQNS